MPVNPAPVADPAVASVAPTAASKTGGQIAGDTPDTADKQTIEPAKQPAPATQTPEMPPPTTQEPAPGMSATSGPLDDSPALIQAGAGK